MRTNAEGVNKIKGHEKFREFAYPDPASDLAKACRARGLRLRWGFQPANEILSGLPADLQKLSGKPWTCGFGETQGVTPDTRWTRAEADSRLLARIAEFERGVLKACTLQPNLNQLMAMVSLSYNIGLGWEGAVKPKGAKDGFRQSSVLRAHNRGDFAAAARAFQLWNKANGEVMDGLVIRRAQEAEMYLRPVHDEVSEPAADLEDPPSQAVDPERSMSQSGINRAGTVAGGTAILAGINAAIDAVNNFKDGLSNLGAWLVPTLLVITVAAVGWIIWQRWLQRRGGWA